VRDAGADKEFRGVRVGKYDRRECRRVRWDKGKCINMPTEKGLRECYLFWSLAQTLQIRLEKGSFQETVQRKKGE
jgi:hypothetical protein